MQQIVSGIDKRKKVIRVSAIAFFAVIFMLTLFSKTINNLLLPEVKCQKPVQRSLEKVYKATGEIKSLGINKIISTGEWNVKEVKAEVNDVIESGTVLAVVDRFDIQIDIKQRLLDIKRLDREIENLMSKDSIGTVLQMKREIERAEGALKRKEEEYKLQMVLYETGAVSLGDIKKIQNEVDSVKQELDDKKLDLQKVIDDNAKAGLENARYIEEKKLELEIKRLEYDKLIENITQDGEIISNVAGRVTAVNINKGELTSLGQVLFDISADFNEFVVEWKLNAEQAKEVDEGDTGSFSINIQEDIVVFEEAVKNKRYLPDEDLYMYTAYLRVNDNYAINGHAADVSIVKRSAIYDFTMPRSSIIRSGEKPHLFILRQRNGVFGEEYYVEKAEIEIEDEDDFFSAVEGDIYPNYEVITYSTKELSDGMQVKLR